MAHAEGWIQAYELLEQGKPIPEDLKKTVLSNKNGIGETMLHWYCIEGTPEVVKKIIDLGFDVNTQNEFGATPLFETVDIGRWNIVELLLEYGANTKIKDQSGDDIWSHCEILNEHKRTKKLKDLTNRFRQRGQARVV